MGVQDWMLVLGIAVASITATLFLIPASRMATPTIVNMVRSTELLFAYAVEFALYGKVPKPVVAAGAALVLASIVTMTLADKIQPKLDKLFHPSSSTALDKRGESDRELGSALLVSDLNESTGPGLGEPASDESYHLTVRTGLRL